jgi:hypothetical protein
MMLSAAGFLASSLASVVLGPSLVVALAAPLQAAPGDTPAPTPIEQALIERACSAPATATGGPDASDQCLEQRLLTLRSEFGRDLSRLSAAERRRLDAACSRLQASGGREGYLDCLHTELASLSARRSRAGVAAAADAARVAALNPPLASASTILEATPASSSPWRSAGLMLIAAAGAMVAGLVYVAMTRRARQTCRACHVRVDGAGDLCPACRHEAAEALRRAAADRDERRRSEEQQTRLEREQAEALRLEKERAGEEIRTRRLEEGRLREAAARQRDEDARERDDEACRRQTEESSRRLPAGRDAREAAFCPYLALGLAEDASPGQIQAAFAAAKAKYDPAHVAHLGDDVQQHFAEKARAAERACRMLTAEADRPAPAAPPV